MKIRTGSGSALILDRSRGLFIYEIPQHMDMNCNMKFENYPMDLQICYFRFSSGLFGIEKLGCISIILRRTKKLSWRLVVKYWIVIA